MNNMVEFYQPQADSGTPESKSDATVTLTIDGREVTVAEGTSVMRAAFEAGIKVPKLCATDGLESFGSCRVCLVEIEGRRGNFPSSYPPAEAGMSVTTQSDQLAKIRRGVMELYISDHPLDCLTCPTNGDCELQSTAGEVGLRDVRYGFTGESHTQLEKDEGSPYFTFDSSKCIVCSRCVRAGEQQGTFALTISGRGFDSHECQALTPIFSVPTASHTAPVSQPAQRQPSTENSIIEWYSRTLGDYDLCLLRCWLRLQGRDAWTRSHSHDPMEGR